MYSIVIQCFYRLYAIKSYYKIMAVIPCAINISLLLIYFIHSSSYILTCPSLYPCPHDFGFCICESQACLDSESQMMSSLFIFLFISCSALHQKSALFSGGLSPCLRLTSCRKGLTFSSSCSS